MNYHYNLHFNKEFFYIMSQLAGQGGLPNKYAIVLGSFWLTCNAAMLSYRSHLETINEHVVW